MAKKFGMPDGGITRSGSHALAAGTSRATEKVIDGAFNLANAWVQNRNQSAGVVPLPQVAPQQISFGKQMLLAGTSSLVGPLAAGLVNSIAQDRQNVHELRIATMQRDAAIAAATGKTPAFWTGPPALQHKAAPKKAAPKKLKRREPKGVRLLKTLAGDIRAVCADKDCKTLRFSYQGAAYTVNKDDDCRHGRDSRGEFYICKLPNGKRVKTRV